MSEIFRLAVSAVLVLTVPVSMFTQVNVPFWPSVLCLVFGGIGLFWKQLIAVTQDRDISIGRDGIKIEDNENGQEK